MIILKNRTISIYRHITNAQDQNILTLLTSGIKVFIEPLSEDILIGDTGIPAYQGFRLMSDYFDIQEGDKIVDENNESYIVKGAKTYDNIIEKHLEGVIISDYDN